jgi:hypothetical protein
VLEPLLKGKRLMGVTSERGATFSAQYKTALDAGNWMDRTWLPPVGTVTNMQVNGWSAPYAWTR